MIFLSHNSKDKPIIEQIATRLYKIFGQANVFYDSWSIQPGEGIIEKISVGLGECKFFFLFVSKNSIDSNMVKLEWQNALMKHVKGELKFVPVRLDSTLLPPVLLQTLYLDLYTNGLEVVISQMVSVINGKNTFFPLYTQFSNLKAYCYKSGPDYYIDIYAEYYMEPKSSYCFLLNNQKVDIEVSIRGSGMSRNGFTPNISLFGLHGNIWSILLDSTTTPGFPIELVVKNKSGNAINLLAVCHEESKDTWKRMPVLFHKK